MMSIPGLSSARPWTLSASLLLALSLSGCGGGDSSSSTGTSSGSSGSGSSGSGSSSSCNYTDLISSSERAQANACGIQVSGSYGMADSHLQQVIAACQKGAKTEADKHYNDVYKKAVQYARDSSKALNCGGSNTTPNIVTPSSQTYYNMCGKTSSTLLTGACYGPVRQGEGGCGGAEGFTYISQHSSQSACTTARESWLKSK